MWGLYTSQGPYTSQIRDYWERWSRILYWSAKLHLWGGWLHPSFHWPALMVAVSLPWCVWVHASWPLLVMCGAWAVHSHCERYPCYEFWWMSLLLTALHAWDMILRKDEEVRSLWWKNVAFLYNDILFCKVWMIPKPPTRELPISHQYYKAPLGISIIGPSSLTFLFFFFFCGSDCEVISK